MSKPHPIHRRRGITAALLALILAVLAAPGAMARAGDVVIVLSADAAPYHQAEQGCKDRLAEQHRGVRSVLLKDVSEKGVDAAIGPADAVVAVGSPAANFLRQHLSASSPLLACMVAGNTFGDKDEGNPVHAVTTDIPISEQFRLITEALPKAHVVGMLYHSNTPEGQRLLHQVQDALGRDWQLRAVAVEQFDSMAAAIDELLKDRVDLVWTSVDCGVYDTATVRALLLAALRNNVPVFGFSPSFVRAGALLGMGIDPAALGRQAADLAGRILAHDDRIPRLQGPAQSLIAVNLVVADKIGLTLPEDLVARAAFAYKGDQ